MLKKGFDLFRNFKKIDLKYSFHLDKFFQKKNVNNLENEIFIYIVV